MSSESKSDLIAAINIDGEVVVADEDDRAYMSLRELEVLHEAILRRQFRVLQRMRELEQ